MRKPPAGAIIPGPVGPWNSSDIILFFRHSHTCTVVGDKAYVIGGTTRYTDIFRLEGNTLTRLSPSLPDLKKEMEGFSFSYGGEVYFLTGNQGAKLLLKMKYGTVDGWETVKIVTQKMVRTTLVLTLDQLFP